MIHNIIFKCLITLQKSNIPRNTVTNTTNIGMWSCLKKWWKKFPRKASSSTNKNGGRSGSSNRGDGLTTKFINLNRTFYYFEDLKALTLTQDNPQQDSYLLLIIIGDFMILNKAYSYFIPSFAEPQSLSNSYLFLWGKWGN